jgi:hypothetical protein
MAIKVLRSPRYPVIGLGDAIDKVSSVYKADYRNKIPKSLVAEHMGYSGINGASLGVISAVSKYGLLDGGRDSMWVTPMAVDILERERGDPERIAAIRAAASEPELFVELDENFPEKASDSALRSYLITKREFLPDSAVKLIRAYRETKEFVATECGSGPSLSDQIDLMTSEPLLVKRPDPDVLPPHHPTANAQLPDDRRAESEWLRGPLSRETSYRILVSGRIGPKEIAKLVKLLEAQRAVLEDDDDGEAT